MRACRPNDLEENINSSYKLKIKEQRFEARTIRTNKISIPLYVNSNVVRCSKTKALMRSLTALGLVTSFLIERLYDGDLDAIG